MNLHNILANLRARLQFPYPHDGAFAALFFAVAFVPLVFGNYLNENIEVPKLTLWVICIAACVVAMVWRKRELALRYHKGIVVLLVLFMAWVIVSSFVSLDVVNSIFGLYGRFTGSIIFYGLWGLTFLLFVANLTKEKFIFLCKTLVFIGGLIGLYALVQNFGFAYYPGPGDYVRLAPPSFLGNANFSAMFVASLVPFGLLFLSQARTVASRIYYATATILMLLGLGIMSSRGALLAAGVALVIMIIVIVLLRLGKRLALISAAGLALLVVITVSFFWAIRPQVLGQTIQLTETTVDQRFDAWSATLDIIKQYPWFGTGAGNYFIGFNEVARSSFSNTQRFDDSHNLVLQIAGTTGPVSALLFLALIGVCIRYGWYTLWRERDPIMLATLVGLLAWLIAGSFTPVVVGCWFLAAFLLAGLLIGSTTSTKTIRIPALGRGFLYGAAALSTLAVLCFLASDALARDTDAAYYAHNYTRSERSARLAVYLNPADPTVSANWAYARIKLGKDPQTTSKIVNFLVDLHPRSPRVHYLAGVLDYYLNQQTNDTKYIAAADQQLQAASDLEPNEFAINGQIAYLYYKMGMYDKALFHTRQVLIDEPSQLYSWVMLAQLYQQSGQRAQLIGALKRALYQQPDLKLLQTVLTNVEHQRDVSKVVLPVKFPDPGF